MSEFKRFFLTEHGSFQAIPVFSHDRASVRGRSPTRVYPQSGRISALAAVRAAYERVLDTSSQRTDSDDNVVTTFMVKSDSVPALRAGRAAFQL